MKCLFQIRRLLIMKKGMSLLLTAVALLQGMNIWAVPRGCSGGKCNLKPSVTQRRVQQSQNVQRKSCSRCNGGACSVVRNASVPQNGLMLAVGPIINKKDYLTDADVKEVQKRLANYTPEGKASYTKKLNERMEKDAVAKSNDPDFQVKSVSKTTPIEPAAQVDTASDIRKAQRLAKNLGKSVAIDSNIAQQLNDPLSNASAPPMDSNEQFDYDAALFTGTLNQISMIRFNKLFTQLTKEEKGLIVNENEDEEDEAEDFANLLNLINHANQEQQLVQPNQAVIQPDAIIELPNADIEAQNAEPVHGQSYAKQAVNAARRAAGWVASWVTRK